MDSEYDDTPESEAKSGAWSGSWRRRIDGPDRNTYRVLRAQFRKQCVASHAVCHICEGGIDYSLRHPDPMAWELDHFVPVSVDESLALESANFRASHSQHNRMRGAGAIGFSGVVAGGDDEPEWPTAVVNGMTVRYNPELGIPSEIW
ncbi:hypothetical protein Y900_004265 [Mycolicibacterium aromaticivorans JS19b1 = JCM 16368]|uniref:HNH nuclease domain-containing protein n=2 Tax=Mycolicibacterium aromaticivorans TaxID=318425 RepID=A0A064CHG6_9MYCO|nr:hypothetical protein Y900_004265 [Mycolicibacterium aromaticivorans JS19b1 = JCM 16368]